mmetsp:Transcript_27522/g.80346  ORF Transcript_27522/g.80346 Transcript_27522/m.80346 type:complete len:403 (-) Transcript_27522:213-1421(-)
MAQSSLEELWSVPGNNRCVDCGVPEPDWASINLGVMVCLDCSGIHRQLGVHISQVRSVKLDTKCWQGELMQHMRSIGNLTFNRVWEGGVPTETVRPSEFPNHPAVREAFILSKYRDRKFFLNAESEGVVDMEARVPRGKDVSFESDVVKLSGATIFGKPKWDSRTLRLGGGQLEYLSKSTVKGTIPLDGCSFSLLDNDTYPGHSHLLAVHTPADGPNDGRRFVFSCESAQLAVKWLQLLRFAAREPSPVHSPPSAPPPPPPGAEDPGPSGTLSQLAVTLASEAGQRARSEALRASDCHSLDQPSELGVWTPCHCVLTPWCLYLFKSADDLDRPIALIPLQNAELEEHGRLIPDGTDAATAPAYRLAVWYPMGYLSIGSQDQSDHDAWLEAIKGAVDQAQQDQ